ncbi:hypothetical protein L2750_03250 [Shewanella submarina]|uniref:Uncharacterized protein n=1 Tax=Shewanella submarina TaxID=2016376 RepID=A0ABV7GLY2_9GAMM|nr:hypothetical protein [Shewanella submarina]MCL1036173.1 hypothetical protein [Shewanella submarina]
MQTTNKYLVMIPALCLCATILVAAMHYLHWIESSSLSLHALYAILTVDVIASTALVIMASGYGVYVLLSAFMFFIVFVFSVATISHQGPAPQKSRSVMAQTTRTLDSME